MLQHASAICLKSDKLKSDLLVTCPGDGRGSAAASADSFHPTPTTSRARKSSLMEYDEKRFVPMYCEKMWEVE